MKYRLQIGEAVAELQVLYPGRPDVLRFITGDAEQDIGFIAAGANRYRLTAGGKSVEAYVVRGDRGKHVVINGCSYFVQDADELPPRRTSTGNAEESPGEVTPPMPSVVVRILVTEGERVKKGRGLVVVTAMKMETTLGAPRDGVVRRICTAVGARVAPGEILVEIGEEGEAYDG